jgi:phosphoglycolate phosphatase-like HAD superfamily hydrolase
MKCYLFDLDGTMCDATHRLHHIQNGNKNWNAFFDDCVGDAPIEHIIDLAWLCAQEASIVYVSGRSDRVRQETMAWLTEHDAPWLHCEYTNALYMRADGDYRPDHVVKLELLAKIRADGFEPIMAFDDRNQVVEMWRANGIPCAQVAPGDF